jgi:hypothetical protein
MGQCAGMSPEDDAYTPAMPAVEVVGVYPVPEAPEPCDLVEVVVRDSQGFDPAQFVQPDPAQPEHNWQVAYDERALSASGDTPITESFELADRPELLEGTVRLVFFMHYLDPALPLRTPFGEVELPAPTERPERLAAVQYEQP